MIDELDNGDCGLARGIALLGVDEVDNLEIQGEIGF